MSSAPMSWCQAARPRSKRSVRHARLRRALRLWQSLPCLGSCTEFRMVEKRAQFMLQLPPPSAVRTWNLVTYLLYSRTRQALVPCLYGPRINAEFRSVRSSCFCHYSTVLFTRRIWTSLLCPSYPAVTGSVSDSCLLES